MENSELITKALSYISLKHNDNKISIEEVASHAGFSTDYFNRIFFAHTGFNVMEYVRFSRLKSAALLLRTTNKDILNIAFDSGYETHERFSRAFKRQYELTPSEYRKKYEKTELLYGDFHNHTVGNRLIHEFKDFKIADTDEVIDYMLEHNAIAYGYSAVCFKVNGGVALYKGNDFKDGFIWFNEWDERFEGDIISDNWDIISEYLSIFSDERFDMVVCTLKNDDEIKTELSNRGKKTFKINRRCFNVYTDKPYEINSPVGFSMRILTYLDYDIIADYFKKKNSNQTSRLKYLKQELYQRDVLGNDEHSVFMFGIFKDGSLVGISDGALQRVHGFVINNCIVTSLLNEYESEELYQYAFKFVTNSALERGALPIDDVQTIYTPHENKSGIFNSNDIGYKKATDICIIK